MSAGGEGGGKGEGGKGRGEGVKRNSEYGTNQLDSNIDFPNHKIYLEFLRRKSRKERKERFDFFREA